MKTNTDISRNHIMFGEIGAWFYKALGGIKPDPDQPGFKKCIAGTSFCIGTYPFRSQTYRPVW